jgi:hypothetical protein
MRNWEKYIPSCIWNDADAMRQIIQPAIQVSRHDEPMSQTRFIRISLTVPKPTNFQAGYDFRTARETPLNMVLCHHEPAVVVRGILESLMRAYQEWAVGFYLKTPAGCLVVWEDEYLPKESGKAYNLLRGEGQVRPKLGVILIEDKDGNVSVQLVQNPERAKESFDELSGRPGDPESRATLLSLDYDGGAVEAATKMLPVKKDRENEPDMYVLGTGPVNFKEGWKEEALQELSELKERGK